MMVENPAETSVKTPKPPDFQPEPAFEKGHRWAGKPRCQAWNRNTAAQCQKIPFRGKRVCSSHGGASGCPPVHGKHSKAMKTLKASLRHLPDPEVLNLKPELAILAARINELMNRIDENGCQYADKEILKAAQTTQRGIDNGDLGLCAMGLKELRKAIEPVRSDAAISKEMLRNFRLMDRITASVGRVQQKNGQAAPIQSVLCILRVVLEIVTTDVEDPQIRARIFSQIGELLRITMGFWPSEGMLKELGVPGRGIFAGLNP